MASDPFASVSIGVALKVVNEMTKQQLSLLLFLETRCVDRGGLVCGDHMNAADFAIAREWADQKFIRFSRIARAQIVDRERMASTHVVELPPQAQLCVAIERARRSSRSQHPLVKSNLEFFEEMRNA